MFRSRQTIAFSIIVLYFIPILFLSLYSANTSPNQTWTLFSFGLIFGIAGTLTLFLLMIQFETAVSLTKMDQDEQLSLKHSLFEDDQANLDFDTIIVNLNAELGLKKRESEKLTIRNLELMSRLDEMTKNNQKQNQVTEIKVSEDEEDMDDEPVQQVVFSVPVATPKPTPPLRSPLFENSALDIEKIEQSLYGKDNRVEVTRL